MLPKIKNLFADYFVYHYLQQRDIGATMSRGTNWVFTLNADERDSVEWPMNATVEMPPVSLYDAGYMRCIFYQLERGTGTGHVHLQGFLVTLKTQRLPAVSKLLPHAHIELMKGNVKQNIEYCSKSETKLAGPWTFGDLPTGKGKGKRTDWSDVKEEVIAGKSKADILMDHPHLAPCFKGIEALIEAARPPPPLQREVKVWFLYGPTGTGKTHRAFTAFPKAYKIKGKLFEGKTFDMYNGEETLILDEWSPYEWPLTAMNDLLDKWECRLQCRYSNKYAYWTRVIICTNFKPEECYPAVPTLQRASFERRLTYKVAINDRETPVDFDTVPTVPSTPVAPGSPDICPIPDPFAGHHAGDPDFSSQMDDPDAAGIYVPPPVPMPVNPRGDFSFRVNSDK